MRESESTEPRIVKLDPALHRRLKIEAAKLGCSMRDLASKAVREYLEREEQSVPNGGRRGRRSQRDEQ